MGPAAGGPGPSGRRVLANEPVAAAARPLFGISKWAADRIINDLAPSIALHPRKRFRKDAVLIVDGTLVPTRARSGAERSKNYRYSTNHQVVVDADTRLVVAVGRPLPGNRNDCKAWELSGAKAAVGKTMVIADGGYRGTGLLIPHRRERGQAELTAWKEEHSASHHEVRALKSWKILATAACRATASTKPCSASPTQRRPRLVRRKPRRSVDHGMKITYGTQPLGQLMAVTCGRSCAGIVADVEKPRPTSCRRARAGHR